MGLRSSAGLAAGMHLALSLGAAAQIPNDTFLVFVVYDPPAAVLQDTVTGLIGGWGWQPPASPTYIERQLVYVRDPDGGRLGCDPPVNAAELAGRIAYISRGVCEFGQKGLNAQNAGAAGFVVHNDDRVPDTDCSLVIMAPASVGAQVTIPGAFMSRCSAVQVMPLVASGIRARGCLSWDPTGFCPSVVVSTDGDVDPAGPVRVSPAQPTVFASSTHVFVRVPAAQDVRIVVLDALGRHVRELYDGTLSAALAHRFTFDGAGLPVGVYFVRVTGETFAETRPAVLSR
jgi:hypothetical protein